MANSHQEETLDRLLDDYRQSGVDSEGVFTLNPTRAREMLEQFQLPEPAYNALHLTSFLIGAGANEVRVSLHKGGLEYVAKGAGLPEEAMASPFSALLKSRVEPYLSELALGLNAILGQKVTVELSSAGRTAHYHPDEIEMREGTTGPDLTLRVNVGGERELQLIAEHFALSPIPVLISGQAVASCDPWAKATLQISLENTSYPLCATPHSALTVRKSTSARFSALLRVGREARGVRVLHLGRLYSAVLPWECGLRGWQVEVLLNTDRLQKDLTQQSLRENETFRNIFATLQQQLERALLDLPLSAWQDEESQALWDSVVAALSRTRKEEAMARQTSLLRILETAPAGLEKANALLRLGLMQNLTRAGSGAVNLDAAKTILAKLDPWQKERVLVKARMTFARPTPELEKTVSALANDSRATGEEKLEALHWLRERKAESAHLCALYTNRIAQQLHRLGRPGLALRELDTIDSVSSADEGIAAKSLEVRAAALAGLGHFGKALESLGQLLNIEREQHGQYSPRLGLTLTRMSVLLEHLGKPKQAKEYREWSQRLQE